MTIRGNALTTHQVPVDPEETEMSGSIVFRTSAVTYSKEQVLNRVERSNKTITTVVRFNEPVSKKQQALMHELFSSDEEEMVEKRAVADLYMCTNFCTSTEWRFVPSGALYRVALCTEWRF
eukprot:COSAG03_NODE_2504_length_2692_cov_73.352487_4_plen_120_part_01